MLARLNSAISITVPAEGGTHTEGIAGYPRFINPVLASSDADRDMTELIYAGLMQPSGDGTLEPELAAEYAVSDDGRVYTFQIREDAVFHDEHPVTAEDVVFTISKTQDGSIRSPQQSNWDGVEVKQIDKRTVQFRLQEPYSPFLENTTIGILPKHRWEQISSEQFNFSPLNTNPIGAGPYEVDSVTRSDTGVPQSYTLDSFDGYVDGEPFISTVETTFFANEGALVRAYENENVEAVSGISTESANRLDESQRRIETTPLPRIFGVFFNQNQAPIFTNESVRDALRAAIDRDQIIEEALNGYGTPVTGPLLPDTTDFSFATGTNPRTQTMQDAREILTEAGWERNQDGTYVDTDGNGSTTLTFSIATANAPELKSTARAVEERWEQFGADVELKFFDSGNLSQEVIRPREYDALLFGQVIGREKDLYAFWHSSQQNDPGLNVAMYANITADDLLEEMRSTTDPEERQRLYTQVQEVIAEDSPAVFLYTPDFIYALPESLKGIDLGTITTPAERFTDVHTWYKYTDQIWKMFADERRPERLQ